MFFKIVASQMRHRWHIALLLWVAMTALVSLYVYLNNSARFTNRSMQLIMKSMGHNLLILPKRADPIETYLCTDRQVLFDADTTRRMAARRRLATKYFTSVLQQRVEAAGGSVILTGIEPVYRGDETAEKAHLDTAIAPGQARLGAEAARVLKAAVGDRIAILSGGFTVAEVLEPLGSLDDCRVYVPLGECQRLLAEPGKISAILSFLCLHGTSQEGISRRTREQFAKHFADFKIITRTRIAQGRYLARMTTDTYLLYLLAVVLCITVVIIVVTGFQEVSDRRRETGILLAMGVRYVYVIGLYVAKLLAVAVLASGTGFLIGSFLSRWLLAPVLVARTRTVAVLWGQLPSVIGLTCLVALLAELLPMIKLVRMDPNAILIEE